MLVTTGPYEVQDGAIISPNNIIVTVLLHETAPGSQHNEKKVSRMDIH